MVGSPRILTEDQGLVILKLTVGLGRYCAELQQGTVRGPCLGALQLLLAVTGLFRKLHGLKFISSKQANTSKQASTSNSIVVSMHKISTQAVRVNGRLP